MLQAPHQEHHIGYQIISNIFILDVLEHSMQHIQELIEMEKLQHVKMCILNV
jgi:hypothetical protein